MDLAREFQAHHIQRERPNGTTLDIRGVPLPGGGWIAIYSDVTEQRRSELALLQSHTDLEQKILERTGALGDKNRRLDVVLETISHGLTLSDTHTIGIASCKGQGVQT